MKKVLAFLLIGFLGIFTLQGVSPSSYSGLGLVSSAADFGDFDSPLEDEAEGPSNQVPEEEEKHFAFAIPLCENEHFIYLHYPFYKNSSCDVSLGVILPPPELV